MGYFVHITDADDSYLACLPLSEHARVRLRNLLIDSVGAVTDDFRNDSANRHAASGPLFRMQFLILDAWGDGRSHTLDVVIDESHAVSGVMLIVYLEHHPPA